MANFFFFTDIDALLPQSAADAFGPTNSLGFQASSKHQLDTINYQGLPRAYAVCSGEVFLVPHNVQGSYGAIGDMVNLVLKPAIQPNNGLPKIRYIIYRGIYRPSLIDINGLIIPDNPSHPNNAPYPNDLTRMINAAAMPANVGTSTATVDGQSLGFGPAANFLKSQFIDDVFYQDNPNYRRFFVNGGDSIGFFNETQGVGFGVDFIFDSVDYNPTFEILEDTNDLGNNFERYTIPDTNPSPNAIPNGAVTNSATEVVRKRIQKEIAKNFLDPCAFYGSFADNAGICARSANTGVDANGRQLFNVLAGNALYTNVLALFYNQNRIYIDIRNPENDSLNFSDNYDNDVIFDIQNSGAFATRDYYGVDGWPCLFFDARDGDFPAGGAATNTISIGLPDAIVENFNFDFNFSNGNPTISRNVNLNSNPTPSLYIPFQRRNITRGLAIVNGAGNFVPIPAFQPGANVDPNGGANTFSSSFNLIFANFNNQTQFPVSNYLRINYLKDPDIPYSDSTVCQSMTAADSFRVVPSTNSRTVFSFEYMENVFRPFSMIIPTLNTTPATPPPPVVPLVNPPTLAFNTYEDTRYVDNARVGGNAFIANNGIAMDVNGNVTLFAFAADRRSPTENDIDSTFAMTGAGGAADNSTFLQYLAARYPGLNRTVTPNIPHPIAPLPPGAPANFNVEHLQDTGALNPVGFGNPSIANLVWITLTAFQWRRLLDINYSTSGVPFDDTGGQGNPGNNRYDLDFIDPSRTSLGLKLINTGRDPVTNQEYVQYEIYLTGEAPGPGPNAESIVKTERTRVVFTTFRVGDFGLTAPGRVNRIVAGTTGYTAVPNGPSTFRIRSNIYLLPANNMTEFEICEYMEYFEWNIRQVWNNNPNNNIVQGVGAGNGVRNQGLNLSGCTLDADQVTVQRGGAAQMRRPPNQDEIFYDLSKVPLGAPGRSFVSGRRFGRMFYQKLLMNAGAPTTRYVDATANVPAHEFGHSMGLEDRYAYWCQVNATNDIILNTGAIHAMHMQGTDIPGPNAAWDVQFVGQYNWHHNLMSTQVPFPVHLPYTSVSIAAEPFVGDEPTYRNRVTAADAAVPIAGNLDNPQRQHVVNVLLTAIQCQVVTNTAPGVNLWRPTILGGNPGNQEENRYAFNDPDPNKQFLMYISRYVNFLRVGDGAVNPNFNLTFVGQRFAGGAISQIATDYNYQFDSVNVNVRDDKQDLRIRNTGPIPGQTPADPLIPFGVGTFCPRTPPEIPAPSDINTQRALSDPAYMQDVQTGGLNTLIQQINLGTPLAALQAPPWNFTYVIPGGGGTQYFDLRQASGTDFFSNVGNGDIGGQAVWDRETGPTLIDNSTAFEIRYRNHPNRPLIIRLLAFGNI